MSARERFEHEVDVLRSVGGSVTTADLRARREAEFYEALPSRDEERAAMDAMLLDDLRMELQWVFPIRHEHEQFRVVARDAVRKLREAREPHVS